MTDKSERSPDEEVTDGASEAINAQFEWSSTAPSTAVLETVAIALNREPTSFGPLYDSVDPEALDALLQSDGALTARESITVCFSFAEQLVTVHGTGDVIVRPVESDS